MKTILLQCNLNKTGNVSKKLTKILGYYAMKETIVLKEFQGGGRLEKF